MPKVLTGMMRGKSVNCFDPDYIFMHTLIQKFALIILMLFFVP